MTDRKWILKAKRADFDMLAQQYNIDPVTARLLVNRDIAFEDFESFLHPKESDFCDPYLMEDMNRGVRVIIHSIEEGHKIRIISDYDVDGVMSNYILYKGLKRVGADVDYIIPHRIKDGYGISEELIDNAINDGVNTIITCDNGISEYAMVAKAKEAGISVVITDHHDIPYTIVDEKKEFILPPADAVIDPKKESCKYPFKDLCGAGVAFKFVQCLYETREIPAEELDGFLEFVAIATICDVVSLTGENRIFAVKGLDKIKYTDNTGLNALIRVNELGDIPVTAYHVGFRIGPCINASGRLESAMEAMDLFLEEKAEDALVKAENLKKINDERKEMTAVAVDKACEIADTMQQDKVYVIYLPDCHESIAGIIAGRIREKYNRPTLIVTDCDDEALVKGSGRSMDGYHMRNALFECEDILLAYGGHSGAAGFLLNRDDLDELRRRLNENCTLTEDDFIPKVYIDIAMPTSYVTEKLIEEIDSLAPFGQGNPKPQFAQKDVNVLSAKILGKEQNVVKMSFETPDGYKGEAIYFNAPEFSDSIVEWFGQEEYDKLLHGWLNNVMLNVVYYPSVNEFNGIRTIQFQIKEYSMAAVREVL